MVDPANDEGGSGSGDGSDEHRSGPLIGLDPLGPPSLAERISEGLTALSVVRDRPGVVALVVALLATTAVIVPRWSSSAVERPAVEELIPQVALTPTTVEGGELEMLIVHVSGAVGSPGVYSLPSTARVVDAVEAAGGPSPDADLHQLNLAALLVDGQQIRVPVPGEVIRSPEQAAGEGEPVDLNRADATRLQTLPGVGPATADAIVTFRDEHGPFRTIDDLLDVPGIGPSKLAAIADAAVVR